MHGSLSSFFWDSVEFFLFFFRSSAENKESSLDRDLSFRFRKFGCFRFCLFQQRKANADDERIKNYFFGTESYYKVLQRFDYAFLLIWRRRFEDAFFLLGEGALGFAFIVFSTEDILTLLAPQPPRTWNQRLREKRRLKNRFLFFTYECCRRRLSLIKMINEVDGVVILLFTAFRYEYLF